MRTPLLRVLQFRLLHLVLSCILVTVYIRYKLKVQSQSSVCKDSVDLVPFVEKIILSLLTSLVALVGKQWTTDLYLEFLFFLGPHPGHMEVPRLGVQLELKPLA